MTTVDARAAALVVERIRSNADETLADEADDDRRAVAEGLARLLVVGGARTDVGAAAIRKELVGSLR